MEAATAGETKRPKEIAYHQADRAPPPRKPGTNKCDHERAAHDEGEGRVPVAGHVEKREDPRRVDHVGNGEAGAKDQARHQSYDLAHCTVTPAQAAISRMAVTVVTATAMNVSVAMMDRLDSRDMPHTP